MRANFDVVEPLGNAVPLLLDSPHSGSDLPADWAPISTYEQRATAWDAYVDELFGDGPEHGAALLRAHFPRTFIDLNRARDDVDPEMIEGELPFVPNPTRKSAVGMGVLRRFTLPGIGTYGGKLPAAQVSDWLQQYYDPYHLVLRQRIEALHSQFRRVRHIDCHSMKSVGNAMNDDAGQARPDFVVSDRDGKTSAPAFTEFVAQCFIDLGYSAQINAPYKGAHLIAAYGEPDRDIYSVQIEVKRGIYMDEDTLAKLPQFARVRNDIGSVVQRIAATLAA